MSFSRLVYSTGGDNTCPHCGKPLRKCRCETDAPARLVGDGIVRIRRETKGRGGKEVTVITGLALPAQELKALAKQLKSACGSGGSVGDGQIEIQGDRRERVRTLLEEVGYTVRLSGG